MMSQKILASVLISCAALVSHSAFAADLEADMKTLAKSTKAFAEAKDIDNAKQQLVIMRQAALSSKLSLPHKLVAEIDRVTVFVDKGQLDQAKTEAINLVNIRNENHKKFR